jgi:hypothetical protein
MQEINQDTINSFIAQLEAHKQALNEYINANLVMRTQLNLQQKLIQDLNAKLEELKPKEIEHAA